MRVGAQIWAALSDAESARTRNPTPRAIAAWQVILASWPPPTMPTWGAESITTGTLCQPRGARHGGTLGLRIGKDSRGTLIRPVACLGPGDFRVEEDFCPCR